MLISEEAMQTENEESQSPHAVTKPQPCHRATDFSIEAIMALDAPRKHRRQQPSPDPPVSDLCSPQIAGDQFSANLRKGEI
ncbi:hypothetical protein CEXT_243481 [Caerostris extrusa]|uniref:Uncharacterized protein n=1 Tax=Caerostris extrusa TaxID=172846 RepID=A0AAV4U140_CAEEX|nr:hypothetical protein CEXT_243481 [Caerostris extrusa]